MYICDILKKVFLLNFLNSKDKIKKNKKERNKRK